MKPMSCHEFQQTENDNLRQLIRLLEKYCGDIELISYGLAPNPNGFCYEILEPDNVDQSDLIKINYLLNTLTSKQENELKHLYL